MGGYFQFFTKNRPQNHQKRAILHTSQAKGRLEPMGGANGQSSPPPPPLATLLHSLMRKELARIALVDQIGLVLGLLSEVGKLMQIISFVNH